MSFTAVIEANISGFSNSIDRAKAKIDGLEKSVNKSLNYIGDSFISIGQKASILSAAIIAAGAASYKMAADFQDAMGATNQIYKSASKSVQDWAKSLSPNYGIAKGEALGYANLMGSLLVNIGQLTEEQAGKQAQRLIELAGDLTAMYGGQTQDAVRALQASLKGNNTMLDNYGIAVNDALVKQRAFVLGLSNGTSELSLQARQTATLSLIFEQTSAAQGQAAREAEGASGSLRSLVTVIKNLATSLGEMLLPVITPVVNAVKGFAEWVNSLSPVMKSLVLVVTGLAAAFGPLLIVIGSVIKLMPILSVAFSTMTGPIGLIVTAISVAVGLIIMNWNSIVDYFTVGKGGQVFRTVEIAVLGFASKVATVFKEIYSFLGLDKFATIADNAAKKINKALNDIKTKDYVAKMVKGARDNAKAFGETTTAVTDFSSEINNLDTPAEDTRTTFEKMIGTNLSLRDSIDKTVSTIDVLKERLIGLQTGTVASKNVRQDIEDTAKKISDLSADLKTLTGGRELNIDVKMKPLSIDAEESELFKDGKFVLPEVDASRFQASLLKVNEYVIDWGQMIEQGIGDIAANIGAAFATGDWKNFGKDMLMSMGRLAQQLGALIIGFGIGADSLKTLFKSPPGLAVAAGAALIALGSAATASASKMMESGLKGGATGGTGSYQNISMPGASDYKGSYQENFTVDFRIGRDELVGTLDTAQQRKMRLG